jgi:hypothetical protein
MDQTEICKYARPGITCELWENVAIGSLHAIAALFCLFLCFRRDPDPRSPQPHSVNFRSFFYISEALWLCYHSVLLLTYIPFSYETYQLLYVCIDEILFVVPFGFVMLIVQELPRQYANVVNPRELIFPRVFCAITLCACLCLGATASFIHNESPGAAGDVMFLWEGCVALLATALVLFPVKKALEQREKPIMPEEAKCIGRLGFVLILFCVNMGVVALYQILGYAGGNPLQDLLSKRVKEEPKLEADTRAVYAAAGVVVVDLPAVLAVIAVYCLGRCVTDVRLDSGFVSSPMDKD